MLRSILLALCFAGPLFSSAQSDSSGENSLTARTRPRPGSPKWYEKINIRGYVQVRYNRLAETNPKLKCEQCDRSIGEAGGLFIRRARIIFFGQISDRVYFYIQPDLASSVSSSSGPQQFAQIRDAYLDVGLDKRNEFRVRLGQSKIPFGFENMQSSQNRLPLDRADALNSPLSNERDLAALFYYAPEGVRERFSMLVNDGFKGSGDYGVVGFGVFNGQTANRLEANNSLHVVGRVTYPFVVGSQIIEPSVQAYRGRYVVGTDQISTGTKTVADRNYQDERVAATLALYPRPFGVFAEYNVGRGPEFNKETDSIETRPLRGGYITATYRLKLGKHFLYPFVRAQEYSGGKKFELDARSYDLREVEGGVEWAPFRSFELVASYVASERRFEDFRAQDNLQKGRFLRLQAQLNF